MSKLYLDLTGRFDSAFGFLAKNIIPRIVTKNPYRFESYEEGDPEFEDITLKYYNEEKKENITLNFASFPFVQATKSAFQTIKGKKEEEPDTSNIVAPPPLISFSREKKLVITELNDQDTEVVERWNTGAWDLRMRGILVDMDEHLYPSELITKIHRLFECNEVIEVAGRQFTEKDISHMYIKNIEITGVVGYQDTIQFNITARSARNVSFTLLKPNTEKKKKNG